MPDGPFNAIFLAIYFFIDLVVESNCITGSLGKVSLSIWVLMIKVLLEAPTNLFFAVFGLPFEMAILIVLEAIFWVIFGGNVPDIIVIVEGLGGNSSSKSKKCE